MELINDLIKALAGNPWWIVIVGFATLVGVYLALIALRKPRLTEEDKKELTKRISEEVAQQVEKIKQGIKEEFNHLKAVPPDRAVEHLAADPTRRENLTKAVALARENKHREAIPYLEACLEPNLASTGRAAVYNLMGNAYLAVSDLPQAQAAYGTA